MKKLTAHDLFLALKGSKGHKSGDWYMVHCPCPEHPDKNPSLGITDGKNNKGYDCLVFNCFGGCQWKKVFESLISQGILSIQEKSNYYQGYNSSQYTQPKNFYRSTTLKQVSSKIPEKEIQENYKDYTYVYNCFLGFCEFKEAKEYMESRGISAKYTYAHHICNIPQDKYKQQNIINNLLKDPKITAEDLIGSGICKVNSNSHLYLSFYNHRLIIPYFADKRTITLQGRIIDEGKEGLTKFYNLPGRPIAFYNTLSFDEAIESRFHKICICEGAIDVISFEVLDYTGQYGFPIGIAGVSNSKGLILLLKELKLNVTVFTDNDKPGQDFKKAFADEYYKEYPQGKLEPVNFDEIPHYKNCKDINDILMHKKKMNPVTGSFRLLELV